jgi:tetratricopeptide (TPR) repeat protein
MTETLDFYQEMLRGEPQRLGEVFAVATQCAVGLDSARAVALFDLILTVKQDYFQAWGNRGSALHDLKRFDEAMDSWARALEINPDHVPALVNRGFALDGAAQYEASLADFKHVLLLQPDNAEIRAQLGITHYNKGVLLQREGQYEEACACYERVLETDSHYPISQLNLSQCLLMLGQLSLGWKTHEWRWKTEQHKGGWLGFSQPVWRGESLKNKTILLWVEQGYGDTFQFARYIPIVLSLGAKVFLLVRDVYSVRFFSVAFSGHKVGVILGGAQAGPFDFHCPLMSLPIACSTDSAEKIPSRVPYLFADAQDSQVWRKRLGKSFGTSKRRIGLVWAGGLRPDQPAENEMDALRSLHLGHLAPLKALTQNDDTLFFSLQLGEPGKQLPELQKDGWGGPPIIDLTADLHDWADTAALIDNLDLVISCDTAVAHLAAAMGKPTWILARLYGCWRWLEARDDSPWYPTVRLFRQTNAGDWAGVVNRVVIALQSLTNEVHNRATPMNAVE